MTPNVQKVNESKEVVVFGEGFYPRVVRDVSAKKKFKFDNQFIVKFQRDDDGAEFELQSTVLKGSSEIVGATSKDMPIGTYSVLVISPRGDSSRPADRAFRVDPNDVDSDTGTDADMDMDTDSDAETDTYTDTDSNTLWETDSATPDTGMVSDTDSWIDSETIVDIDAGVDTDTAEVCSGWEFGGPEVVTGLGPAGDLFHPSLSADGLNLYFAEWNNNEEEIFAATRDDSNSDFTPANKVSAVNQLFVNDGTPHVTADGLSLYFFSDRLSSQNRDIMVVQRTDTQASWGAAGFVDELNSDKTDHHPWVSADGLEFLFVSCRNDPLSRNWTQGADIFRATRTSTDEPFGNVQTVETLRSSAEEGSAALTPDGLTVLFSSNRAGFDDYDIYKATRDDTTSDFSVPELVESLSSAGNDLDVFVSRDGSELFFVSDRAGGHQIYRCQRVCTSP